MRELRTEILINASAASIWSVLTDFEKYPEWNPFILYISGHLKLRERLTVTIQPLDARAMVFKPRVTLLKKNVEFAWLGQLGFSGIFDGHHKFEIKEIDENQCLLVHSEQFSGLLVPLFWKKLDINTRAGFESMNERLKLQAEAL